MDAKVLDRVITEDDLPITMRAEDPFILFNLHKPIIFAAFNQINYENKFREVRRCF